MFTVAAIRAPRMALWYEHYFVWGMTANILRELALPNWRKALTVHNASRCLKAVTIASTPKEGSLKGNVCI